MLLPALGACVSNADWTDLNALIREQCGPPGYRADSGCKLQLPGGTIPVTKTIQLGGCTTTTVRNSVALEGRSAGTMISKPRRAPSAGTTLQWKGPPGGVMFDACGANFLSFRDLTLDAKGAGVGIRVSADNKASATSHFVELRNVVVDGAEVGVHVTGKNFNDQTDFVVLDHVSLYNVDVGYLQDSQQSVGGRLETVEVTARRTGYEIRNGSLTCDGCYVGSLGPGESGSAEDFIGFHLRSGTNRARPGEGYHQVHIEHSHMELRRGRFVVADKGSHFPITLIGNSYSLQCPKAGCEMMLVDASNNAPLVMIGDVIQASSNPPAHPRARVCHRGPELVHIGVHKKPEVSELSWTCSNP